MASSKARQRNRPASGRSASAGNQKGSRTAAAASATPTSAQKRPNGSAAKAPAPQSRPANSVEPAGWQPASPPLPEDEAPAVESGPPLWLQIVSFALAIGGLAISGYETYAHFNGSHLAGCPTGGGGTFNCTAVITSPQSMVFGVIPVAILGLAFYVFGVAIFSPWAWRIQRREVHLLRLVSMVAGMGFVLYLIYAELYQIGDVCEYCSGVHIVTFLLFCITVFSAALWGLGPRRGTSR